MNQEESFPTTPTAPLHAGKRDSNFSFLNFFRYPFKPTQVKNGKDMPTPKQSQATTKVPLPTNHSVRDPVFIPFEGPNYQKEIENLVNPVSNRLRNAIIFFVFSLIFLSIYLIKLDIALNFNNLNNINNNNTNNTNNYHIIINISNNINIDINNNNENLFFLLFSIAFFSLSVYPFAIYIHDNINKNKQKDEKNTTNYIQRHFPKKTVLKPSEKISMYESKVHNQKMASKVETSPDLYPQYINADRPSALISKVSSSVRSTEEQIDSLANDTLNNKLGMKLSDFQQYYSNLKNFIQKRIITKIALTSDKPYVSMILDVPGQSPDFVKERIRYLASSPYLAGHNAEKGDNQIVLHILSVWLSYLMTNTSDDKRPRNVFAEKFIITDGKEPKIESDDNIYFIANQKFNSFYVITRSKRLNAANEASSDERYYTYPGKDSMYSCLTIFFYIIKSKFQFLLDGADLEEPPFYMNRIFEPSHYT